MIIKENILTVLQSIVNIQYHKSNPKQKAWALKLNINQ